MTGAIHLGPSAGPNLDDATLVGRGREREVYLRPRQPRLLYKVPRCAGAPGPGAAPHRVFLREYDAYLRAMVRAVTLGRPPPLPHLRGLALSPGGLVQLVEHLRDAEGRTAPTLAALLKAGPLPGDMVAQLDHLAAELHAFRIPVTDIEAHNVVHETRRGRDRLVLVDGFGSRNWVPLRRWIPVLGARRLDRELGKLARACGLRWDRRARRFASPEARP